MSVEENKAVVRQFFEEVFKQQQPEVLEELLADSVVDHNQVIFTEPDAPQRHGGRRPDVARCVS